MRKPSRQIAVLSTLLVCKFFLYVCTERVPVHLLLSIKGQRTKNVRRSVIFQYIMNYTNLLMRDGWTTERIKDNGG